MIEAKQLTKKYGNFTAVRDVSFAVGQGEVVGLLGPNGAGKTTIMRMLTGYSPPTSGTAVVAGHDMALDPLQAKARVGYLPEGVPLYPEMTVREYVNYCGQLHGLHDRKARRERVAAVVERVGLTYKANKLVSSLSKGMRQRLGVAQALVHSPDVIILDEPTIGIDPRQVIEVREMVRELGQEHAVLFSTHILTEAEQVCDRLLIINQGRIVAEGTPDELRRLQGSAGFYIEFDAALDVGRGLLEQAPGVSVVQASGRGHIVQLQDESVRSQVFIRAAEAELPIVEMRPLSLTLEEIFLNIIGNEG